MAEAETADYDVVVVGAGISGLGFAHWIISNYGLDRSRILVLEASDYIGGRIKSDDSKLEGFSAELGAEFLHGQETNVALIAKQIDAKINRIFCTSEGDGGPDSEPVNGKVGTYCVKAKNGELKWFDYNSSDPDFIKAHSLCHNIADVDPADRNSSFLEWLRSNQVNDDMIALLEAGYANTACSTLSNLSLRTLAKWSEYWEEVGGDEDYDAVFDQPFSFKSIINFLVADSGLEEGRHIRLNSPVRSISTSVDSELVKVSTDKSEFLAKAVVVSSSPMVLKSGLIEFNPPLPEYKLKAFESLDFCPAMKIFAVFDKQVFPAEISAVICGGEFSLPELYWREVDGMFITTAFVTAKCAQNLIDQEMEEAQMVEVLVNQLVDLAAAWNLGVDVKESFIKGWAQVWSPKSTPYIRGGYHSPKFGPDFDPNYNEKIRENINNQIFFCGEAANVNEGSTTSSALGSGRFAADDLAAKFGLA